MRKKIVTVVFLMFGCTLFAQTSSSTTIVEENADKYKVETNHFWDNWFISAGGGAQMYFGDHNKKMDFGDRLSPALDFALGKWFTPGIGIRLMYSGLSIKGVTQNGSHSNGTVYDASQGLYEQKFDMMNLHGDVMFNLSNLLFGYKEDRFYSLAPYLGLGWMLTWDSPRAREITANVGLLNTFRLGSAFDLNFDIRGSLVKDRFDGELGGRKEEGLLSATIGLTYKFKQRGWNRSTVKAIRYSDDELSTMRDRLADMGRENESLRNKLATSGNQKAIKEIVVEKSLIAPPCLVTFPIGKSTLSNENRVNLGFLAKVIKESKGFYTVTGYADKGTGSTSLNERLSKARAQAVYDALVNEFGVSASQLKVSFEGGVDDMYYNDPRLSRAVITESK